MYLLSMPWEEAKVFASYERYMTTIIIIIIGLIYLYFLSYKEKKYNFKVLSITVILLMLSTTYLFQSNVRGLLGNDDYQGTKVEKYDNILKNYKVDKEKMYYIYSPSSQNDFSYLYHMSVYKLNTENVQMIYNEKDLPIDKTGVLIFIDEDKKIIEKALNAEWNIKTNLILEK